MTAIKTGVGAQDQAQKLTHTPTTDIPKSNVWDAIKYVYDTLAASIVALTASIAAVVVTVTEAQFTASVAGSRATQAIAEIATLAGRVRRAEWRAVEARSIAMTARAQQRASTVDSLKIALTAQVYN